MRRTKILLSSVVIIAALFTAICSPGGGVAARAASRRDAPPADIKIELEPIVSGLHMPVLLTNARDGSNRLFIVEQPGRILVLQPGANTPSIFLDITSRVACCGERGLLGLTFHPQYATNRRFFVDYTRRSDGATVVAEYRVSASNPNVAETDETVLLTIAQPFANHNGGMVEFGPDGYLYIALGDGGSANDPGNRAQNVEELLGKILRIDVDTPSGAQPYSSPSDNPFFGPARGRDEIFALGLRNPWRFSFDRLTGELYAADVGQNATEEIDIITRGGNYGWRVMEGSRCNPNLNGGSCNTSGFINPVHEYGRAGGRCSVTGGYVYRGSLGSLPQGAYIFGDYCSGEILQLNGRSQQLLLDTGLNISSFGEDEAGEIYVVGLGGTVQRLVNPEAVPPAPLRLDSATVRRRSSGEPLEPLTVKNNGKKYEVVVRGQGFATGAVIVVNGRELNTRAGLVPTEELIARLRRGTLAAPGQFVVEVINPGGVRSNQFSLEVLATDTASGPWLSVFRIELTASNWRPRAES